MSTTELTCNFNFSGVDHLIERVEDKSDPDMIFMANDSERRFEGTKRIHIFFKNEHTLSIIRGEHSYGGPQGLFEMMPGWDGFLDILEGEEWNGDSVIGYCDVEKVNRYIKFIAEYQNDGKN